MPSVLLTGGTGFIGSHTCVELLAAGWTPILLDNLCNSSAAVLDRIEAIAGRRPAFVEADLLDRAAVERAFTDFPVEAVIHLAGLKAVGESMADPFVTTKTTSPERWC
jgi:UDP-glucose 4-epimerase